MVALLEVGLAEVAIFDAADQHVIGGDQYLVGDGNGRAHGAAAGLEAVVIVLGSATIMMDVALPRLKCSQGPTRCLI